MTLIYHKIYILKIQEQFIYYLKFKKIFVYMMSRKLTTLCLHCRFATAARQTTIQELTFTILHCFKHCFAGTFVYRL